MAEIPRGTSNEAWSNLEDNILDFLQFSLNVICLTVNIVFACYRRTERRDNCDKGHKW